MLTGADAAMCPYTAAVASESFDASSYADIDVSSIVATGAGFSVASSAPATLAYGETIDFVVNFAGSDVVGTHKTDIRITSTGAPAQFVFRVQAMSTNILNYVLKLESEKQRLRVKRLPPPATAYTFRDVFPVPPTSYASSIDDAYAFLDRYLFCNHRIMVRLLALWQRFQSCLLVVRVDTDLAIETPMEIDEFARLQQVQHQETVAKMTDEWFQEVMKIFFEDDAAHRAKRAQAPPATRTTPSWPTAWPRPTSTRQRRARRTRTTC